MKEIAIVLESRENKKLIKTKLITKTVPENEIFFSGHVNEDQEYYLSLLGMGGEGVDGRNSFINLTSSQWSNDIDFIKRMKERLSKTNKIGYLIEHENCFEYWIKKPSMDGMSKSFIHITIKFTEIKGDDCVLLIPSDSTNIISQNNKIGNNTLDSLWKVTQLNAVHDKNLNPFNIDTGRPFTPQEWDHHLINLWKTKYYISGNPEPICYYFPKEDLDFNDLCYETGDFKSYTLADYAINKQLEQDYLVYIIRADCPDEKNMQELIKLY